MLSLSKHRILLQQGPEMSFKTKRFRTLSGLLTGLSVLILAIASGCVRGPEQRAFNTTPKRVISFAPSITETFFALGLGDRVVGVTRYCSYPPQVRNLPRVGGYTDPNFEMILSLKPDMVFLLKEHSSLSSFLQKNGIGIKVVDNEDLDAILASFRTIGAIFGRAREADSIVATIRSVMSDTAKSKNRPRILLCIGRDNPGAGSVAKVYAAGPKSFYNSLIQFAGGTNAYSDSSFIYPSVSAEGIIRLAPDVIIDLMSSASTLAPDAAKEDWKNLSMVPAVRNGLVFCPSDDYMTIPGPRMGLILRYIRKTVVACQARSGP
jgi:iron complex transport system substrate-binding protein